MASFFLGCGLLALSIFVFAVITRYLVLAGNKTAHRIRYHILFNIVVLTVGSLASFVAGAALGGLASGWLGWLLAAVGASVAAAVYSHLVRAVMGRSLPTERKVLRCIYDMYESSYLGNLPRPFVPIDMKAVAQKLNCSQHLLFGYLSHHLDHKHRYQTGEDTFVHLFAPQVGELRHAVNFPYLAALLAGHDQEHSKFAWSLGVSLVALALSVGAIVAQVITAK